PDAVQRAERVLGLTAESWTPVVSRGWSCNEHWTIECHGGTRAFVKVASIEPSPQWVRDEVHVYRCVEGPFMPRFLGWEDGEEPLLVLEYVSAGATAAQCSSTGTTRVSATRRSTSPSGCRA